jgi:hypothetical protein
MKCRFTKNRKKNEGVVKLDGREIPKSESFWHLRSIILFFLYVLSFIDQGH